VDEATWLATDNPFGMLGFLGAQAQPSGRKLRLFACACCRLAWPALNDPRSRAAVEVAERFVDGLANHEEVSRAWQEANEAALALPRGTKERAAAEAA
jgi:hypothetical protein